MVVDRSEKHRRGGQSREGGSGTKTKNLGNDVR